MIDWGFDRWVGVIGTILGAIGFAFAYYAYRRTLRTKVLAYSTTEAIPFLFPFEGLSALYQGKELKGLSRVFVLLWNRGSDPIEQEDFVTPIEVRNGDNIVKFDIKDKDSAADVQIDLKRHALHIGLLRPNEAIILQIDAGEDSYKPDLFVNMKSPNMSQKLRRTLQFLPTFVALLSGVATAMLVLYQSDDVIRLGESLFGTFSVFAGMLFMIVLLIAPLVVGLIFLKLGSLYIKATIPVVVRRFLALHVGAMPVPNAWKTIKKSLDEAEATAA